ncbi:hypothetical protein EVAR_63993_1 [Eumeta japonica]|uniref:Uncharacterized protein n=1 Tax=Eumeta variegata TaxID=151549 RepID=A0A4C1YYM7_EUMVA|nr:hypothetical protein EVAR_63993_1 [Eumeta japonica]
MLPGCTRLPKIPPKKMTTQRYQPPLSRSGSAITVPPRSQSEGTVEKPEEEEKPTMIYIYIIKGYVREPYYNLQSKKAFALAQRRLVPKPWRNTLALT